MEKYLVNWQAHNHTSYVETIRAKSLDDASKRIIAKYQIYAGFEDCVIKIISVTETLGSH